MSYHPDLVMDKHLLPPKREDGVLFGYYHPFLKCARVVADTEGKEIRQSLASRGYECVEVRFYVPEGKTESDCTLAFQPKHEVVRTLMKRLHEFQITLEEMTAASEQYGETKFGGEGEAPQLKDQYALHWHLFRASIQGD